MDDMYCDEVCVSSCSANPTTNSKIHLRAQVYEFSRIDKCEIKQQQQQLTQYRTRTIISHS